MFPSRLVCCKLPADSPFDTRWISFSAKTGMRIMPVFAGSKIPNYRGPHLDKWLSDQMAVGRPDIAATTSQR